MTEEKKVSEGTVLYLLGAGASAKALPVSAGMRDSLRDFINDWGLKCDQYATTLTQPRKRADYESCKKEFFEAAKWAHQIAGRYGSFDTYARQLHIRGETAELGKLKAFLSAYFLAIQGAKGIDHRYDMFLGDLLQPTSGKAPALPETIRIASWNYDTQLEAAYFGFCRNADWTWEYLHGKILKHFNGWSGSVINTGYGDDFTLGGLDAVVQACFRFRDYQEATGNIHLDFAFEYPVPSGLTREFDDAYKNVETAVVIGYSFPVLNRKIDRELFKAMPRLRNIHVQVTPEYRSEVTFAAREMAPGKEIIFRDYLDRFYIPEEANAF